MSKEWIPMGFKSEVYNSLDVSHAFTKRYLEMSPIHMCKDPKHLLMNWFDDTLMEVWGEGSISFSGKEFFIRDSIRYVGHDEI